MKLPQNLLDAFQRLLDNRYSEKDLRLIQDHFQEDGNRELLCQLIAKELANTTKAQDLHSVDSIIEHADQKVLAFIHNETSPGKSNVRILYYIVTSAAALLLLYFALYPLRNKPAKTIIVSASYGAIKEIWLPDSTKVYLNAGTTIEYPEIFKTKERRVTIKDGQAFFEVKHDTRHPFVVVASHLHVSVLGTSFEVKSYAMDQVSTVTVSTGKVGVIPGVKPATILLPNQQAVYEKRSEKLQLQTVLPGDIASWRNNQLSFEKESFADIANALERKYMVHFRINSATLLTQRITLRLNNQPLDQILSVMAFSNNFKYSIQKDTVVVNQ